ncbi:hypothetical protein ACFL47_02375, partial [Candidatus Latescibacterota bacterium]
LDRFISLLDQVMTIQRFETAKRILEDIAFREATITEKNAAAGESSPLSRDQEALSYEMEHLEDELTEIADKLNEQFGLETEKLKEKVESHEISEKMEETAGVMSESKSDDAGEKLQDINSQLASLMENMVMMDSSMKSKNTAEMKKRLFKAALALLAVSEKQEELIDGIGSSSTEDSAKLELEVIDGLVKTRRYLNELSAIFVEITDALSLQFDSAKMTAETALDLFASGSAVGGRQEAVNTLTAINRTVHFLTMLLSTSENGKMMPGDLMSQLQQIASGQLSLNMQMGQEMLSKHAAQQKKMAQMLSELASKFATDKHLREMLEKIVQDMDDTADMMRRNEEREQVERQQLDIYRRLLDARRSRREKDEERERKSWTAKENTSIGAEELAADRGEKKQNLNERIKRALDDDFNPEFTRLIRQYFESMLVDSPEVTGQ